MDCKVLMIGSREVVLEINDGSKFESDKEYCISVPGREDFYTKRTVVSLYDLEPNKEISIKVNDGEETEIVTVSPKAERVLLNVKDFGAKGDGQTNDTAFIQAAIMACPDSGRVVIPEGTYRIYPLFLKSHMTLEITKGATLLAYTDRENFPILPGNQPSGDERGEYFIGTWEGDPQPMFAGLLTGINVKDVLITGEGALDGNASVENWWNDPKTMRIATRPRMIFLNQCENVTVQGITVKNSPAWNIHPFFSKSLGFYDIKIISPKVSPNTDGLNPESCKNVDIVGVYFSVGDDCIAIKSGKIYMGAKYKTPSQSIRIRKCRMQDGHGAIVIGSENAGGVRDILVEDCEMKRTDRGLRIKTRRGRGKDAILTDIHFNRIDMDHVMTPVVINCFYFCDSDGHSEYVQSKEAYPVDERTPELGTFLFENIKAVNCHVAASYFYGLPEKKIEEVTFRNVDISFAKDMQEGVPAMMDGVDPMKGCGLFAKNVAKLQLENVTITGQIGPEKILD